MMQIRISETAQNRQTRLECQRNVILSTRMAIWKDKENAAYSYNPSIVNEPTTSEVAVISWQGINMEKKILYWKQEIVQSKKLLKRTAGPIMLYNIL
ncbi:hypothetical protein TNIN_137021 [Trichonephila inaurata madagascariensis]|uniref:Uncharacterized protein n=1 Tax=Trichonephila inaurata madagascariensis TaxID=2747483 RepID=A0A8X7CIT7_9ARAC|nr:hypothetical protein TNIN_137021 [Trichonephila inaurata madagascariensis]